MARSFLTHNKNNTNKYRRYRVSSEELIAPWCSSCRKRFPNGVNAIDYKLYVNWFRSLKIAIFLSREARRPKKSHVCNIYDDQSNKIHEKVNKDGEISCSKFSFEFFIINFVYKLIFILFIFLTIFLIIISILTRTIHF